MFTVESQHKGSHIIRYEATTSLLNTILLALQKPIEDESWWKIRTDIVFLCLLEMTTFVTEHSVSGIREEHLILWSVELAVPHVRDMAVAMVRGDRPGAVHAGTRAFERLIPFQPYWVAPVGRDDSGNRTGQS